MSAGVQIGSLFSLETIEERCMYFEIYAMLTLFSVWVSGVFESKSILRQILVMKISLTEICNQLQSWSSWILAE